MKPRNKPRLPTWTLLCLSLFLAHASYGQIQFTTHILHDFGAPVTLGKIKAGDLDQDSLIDIVASGANPNVVWFKNQGDHVFGGMTQIYDAEIFGEAVDLVDYDDDNH